MVILSLMSIRLSVRKVKPMKHEHNTNTIHTGLERYDEFSIADYLGQEYTCSCGKTHWAPIHNILVEEGALYKLPKIIMETGCSKPFLLFDSTTYSITVKQIESILTDSHIAFSYHKLAEAEPVPDERTIGEVVIHYDSSCDLIIAVGSGTLNDVCRYISYKLILPYIIIATAPSMDGFASGVTPLIVDHMKTTFEAHTPHAIIGDISILKEAPGRMIAAGVGDILGKYNALCDWSIARLLLGEYHCSTIEAMVRKSLETVLKYIDGARSREPYAIGGIMEALVLSGIAMSYAGNSRPASGSEHHLSHYWEMKFLSEGRKPYLHGTQVGVATIAVLKAYELLLELPVDFEAAIEEASHYSESKWEAEMIRCYGPAAPSVIRLEKETRKNSPEQILERLELTRHNWDKIRETITHLPSADSIRDILRAMSAPASPMEVGIDKDTFIDSFLVAKELRNRYALLQLLFDLGLSREIAMKVWNYFQAS